MVYECLNQDQVVSPLHFNTDLPRLHVIREAAYRELEIMLEEEGPLNPYEYLLMKPQEEMPSSVTELEDYYNMSNTSSQEINTQHMEDWSILSTELHYTHQKSTENESLLVLEGQDKLTSEWIASGKAPTLERPYLPQYPNSHRLFRSI